MVRRHFQLNTGKNGYTATMGIRKVSVQNSADWQGQEASQ
jgi:hypothetical protein